MDSTFSGIEMAKRGLFVHSKRMGTVGHNIANMSTEGYSRQRVEVSAFSPLYKPHLNRAERPGQIGQGVESTLVRRIRDALLEARIVSNQSEKTYWETRSNYLLQLEQLHNEPSNQSIRTTMDKFWNAWQELSVYPEQLSARHAVLQLGQALTESIQARGKGLTDIRYVLEDDIQGTVMQANEYMREIAVLNREIVQVEAEGDLPNDLYDKRDLAVQSLSELVSIEVLNKDEDEFSVYMGGIRVVQGGIYREFASTGNVNNYGFSDVTWADTGERISHPGGRLESLLVLRDGDVREEMQILNEGALTLMALVNETHRNGFGLNGRSDIDFFTIYNSVLNAQGNYDNNGDGIFDETRLFNVIGENTLDQSEQLGIAGELTFEGRRGLISVSYAATDTVGSVVQRINNSEADVIARLDRDGRLELRARPSRNTDYPDFVLREMSDSGEFLVGYAGILNDSGEEGAFRWDQANAVFALRGTVQTGIAPLRNPSSWIEINEVIRGDVASIAAGAVQSRGEQPRGDGSIALEIAGIRNKTIVLGDNARNFDDYFADTTALIGLKGEESRITYETREAIQKNLEDTRQSISGVNLDEELAEMLKFQQGYQALARFITNYDELIDTIIHRMG